LGLNIRFKGYIRRQHIYAVRGMVVLEVFTLRNFVAEFIRFKLILIQKNGKFTF